MFSMSQTRPETLERVREKWRADGVVARSPVRIDEIRAIEMGLCVRICDGFCDYLLFADGMDDGSCDGHLVRFLPLSEMKALCVCEENARAGHFLLLAFADVLIGSHWFALCIDGQDREAVFLVEGARYFRVAASVQEFFDLYLERPDRLFLD